jgi:hypothetical protein
MRFFHVGLVRNSAAEPDRPATLFASGLALPIGESKGLPDTRKGVSLCSAAGVTFVNRRPQRDKLGLVLLFFALQCSKRCADNLTGVFITATFDLRQYEAVKLVGQIDITRWHCGVPYPAADLKESVSKLAKIAKRLPLTSSAMFVLSATLPHRSGAHFAGLP